MVTTVSRALWDIYNHTGAWAGALAGLVVTLPTEPAITDGEAELPGSQTPRIVP